MSGSLYSAITSWEEWFRLLTPEFKRMTEKERGFISELLRDDYRVLEIGSGTGISLHVISHRVKEAVGVEHDYLQVKESEKHLPPNVRIVYADANDLPFENDTFDLTFSTFNFLGNQWDNKFRVLKEKKRVTKNNGNVVASVYAENALDYQLEQYRLYQKMLREHGYKTTLKTIGDTTLLLTDGYPLFYSERFSKDKLVSFFREARFKTIYIDELTDFSYIVNARK